MLLLIGSIIRLPLERTATLLPYPGPLGRLLAVAWFAGVENVESAEGAEA